MSLNDYTDIELIAELISRNKIHDAPTKTTYGGGMKVLDIGLGKDEAIEDC